MCDILCSHNGWDIFKSWIPFFEAQDILYSDYYDPTPTTWGPVSAIAVGILDVEYTLNIRP